MSADPQDDARLTNSEILRELREASGKHSTALAVLETQIGTVLGLVERFAQQFETLTTRVTGAENADVAMRERLVTLESRPLAMAEKERTALQDNLKTVEKLANSNDVRIALLEAQPADFSPSEVEETKRYLGIARRRNVDDALDPGEIDKVRLMLGADASRRQTWVDLKLLISSNLVSLVAGALVLGIGEIVMQRLFG